MKKIIAIVLSLALVSCMSIAVFAAEEKDENLEAVGSSTSNVDVKVEGTESIETVYYVTVDWDSLDFAYSFDDSNEWNPQNHTYTKTSDVSGWDKESANIQVINHSNAGVKVNAAIDQPTKNGVTAALDNAAFDLATGVGLTFDTADKDTIAVNVSGIPTVETDFTIGTVTVTFSDAAAGQ